jgi:hypothetical protein
MGQAGAHEQRAPHGIPHEPEGEQEGGHEQVVRVAAELRAEARARCGGPGSDETARASLVGERGGGEVLTREPVVAVAIELVELLEKGLVCARRVRGCSKRV